MILVGIPLIVLLAVFVSMGYATTARSVASGLTSWMPGWLKKAAFFALPVVEQAVRLTKYLTHELGTHFGSLERQAVRWFVAMSHYVDVVGYWSLLWPVVLVNEVIRLTTHVIPQAVNARTKPLSKRIDAAEAQAKAAAGLAHSIPKVAKAHDQAQAKAQPTTLPMPWADDWTWIHKHIDTLKKVVLGGAIAAVAGVLPHAPAWPLPWRGIKKEVGKLWKFRNYVLSATGAAAIVAIAIGGVTASCIKKGNIGKAARSICRAPTRWLENLLAGLVLIIGGIGLWEFSKETHNLMDFAAGEIRKFWRSDAVGVSSNPGLGDSGAPHFLNTSRTLAVRNPGLGDIA